jgi:acyl dehydratase
MIVHIPLSSLPARVGTELGVSDWMAVTQERITLFADATGDHQWIHLDAERAAIESPYGSTIAHGFLTLSLITTLLKGTIGVDGTRMTVNYGCDRVRFVSAVPAGAKIRGRFVVAAVEEAKDGVQVRWGVTLERDGAEKPCLVLDWLVRYYPA